MSDTEICRHDRLRNQLRWGSLTDEIETLRADLKSLAEDRTIREKMLVELQDEVDVLRKQLADALEVPESTVDGCDCGNPGLPDVPGHLSSCARWRRGQR